jgi:hypothetical protein
VRLTRTLLAVALVACGAAMRAHAVAVLEYGSSASLALDAGGSHWFVNAGGAGVIDTGLITQGISDTARGGSQAAATSAYASIGALGAASLASSSGSLLEGGQATNDLAWTTDFLVTGTPGRRLRTPLPPRWRASPPSAACRRRWAAPAAA